MKCRILIIFLSIKIILSLEGEEGSMCYKVQRVKKPVDVDNGIIKIIINKAHIAICCDGYVEHNDECIAECNPPCEYGHCVKPNKCDCVQYYTGPSCNIRTNIDCPQCDEKCPPNTFGIECAENCTCVNGDCHPVTGFCHCYPGWMDKSCSRPCENGTYGLNCKEKCQCVNGGICNPVNGDCQCLPGFFGRYCKEQCQNGYWGLNCTNTCDCGTSNCNPIDGRCMCSLESSIEKECEALCINGNYVNESCVCNEGWNGQFCTETSTKIMELNSTQFRSIESEGIFSISIIIIIIISSVGSFIIAVILIILIYISIIKITAIIRKRYFAKPVYHVIQLRRTSSNTDDMRISRLDSHIYEEIQEESIKENCNRLSHVPNDNGYLIPRNHPMANSEEFRIYQSHTLPVRLL